MTVRIANAQGFWGDSPDAPRRTLRSVTDLDYLTLDYLAELTMIILARQQAEDGDYGYAKDVVPLLADISTTAIDAGVTIVTNAGGVNPIGCQRAVLEALTDADVDATIATVTGDDFRDRVQAFSGELTHTDTDEALPEETAVTTANAYFGAFPVADAIAAGADIVLTGRVTDTALIMGPLIYEHGWQRDDYDRLARGLIAGHIIECGSQATGGNFHGDWRNIDFANIGYPVAEVDSAGKTTISKTHGSDGLVNEATVAEQLLYEVGDPTAYHGPDVIADFSGVELERVGEDQIVVTGVRGRSPTDTYKASLHYPDGWQVKARVSYASPDVREKAERAVEYLRKQLGSLGVEPREFVVEYFGADAFHDGYANDDPEEIEVRVGVEVSRREDALAFAKRVTPLGLGGPPGCVIQSGRPTPRRKYVYHPVYVPKAQFTPTVEVERT